MRRVHLILGLLGVVTFLITGQLMKHHNPPVQMLTPEVRMMYVSRHIYLLGAALVNLVLGLYLREYSPGWRRTLQRIGSVLIFLSVLSLLMAFISEPALGLAGRSWRSYFGLISLFAGVMTHLVAAFTGEH
jgi:MFS family permease